MPGKRLPIDVVIARGKKHLTEAEIEARKAREVDPIASDIVAPDYLTEEQTEMFYKIASDLMELRIIGNTDIIALANFVVSQDLHIKAIQQLQKPEVINNPSAFETWSKLQDKYFRQARAGATDLGLTITSRSKIVAPEPKVEERVNKFDKFNKTC